MLDQELYKDNVKIIVNFFCVAIKCTLNKLRIRHIKIKSIKGYKSYSNKTFNFLNIYKHD